MEVMKKSERERAQKKEKEMERGKKIPNIRKKGGAGQSWAMLL